MFGWLFGKRKVEKTGKREVEKTLEFDHVPDGKYIVKFEEQNASPGQFVVVSLRVQHGEHGGSLVPLLACRTSTACGRWIGIFKLLLH